MRLITRQSGYTTIELIVAMSIFAVVLVVAIGSFVSVQNTSTKAAAQRRVQQDVRYNFENLTRQTRSATIDYAFYANSTGNSNCSLLGRNMLALLVTEAGESNAPVTKRVYYYKPANTSYLVSKTYSDVTAIPTCTDVLSSNNQVRQTDDARVNVTTARFFITPTADPAGVPVTDNGQNAIRNTHPRVTLLFNVQSGQQGGVKQTANFDAVKIQTTVSTRAYPLTTVYGQGGP